MKHTYTDEQYQKAEAELARIVAAAHEAGWNGVDNPKDLAQFIKRQAEELTQSHSMNAELIKEKLTQSQFSQLRPISEAGPVPEWCVRVTARITNEGYIINPTRNESITHFADIQLPAVKADDSAKPDPYAELKAAHAAGKVIQSDVNEDCDHEDWRDEENPDWKRHPSCYRIKLKPEPETFEAHGKTWTRHTPGDPMPCDENHWIETINKSGGIMGQCYAKQWDWKAVNHVIGWRYAGEPESQQEPAWTPKVGDVVTLKSGGPKMTVTHADGDNIITAHAHNTEIVTMAWSAASLQPA